MKIKYFFIFFNFFYLQGYTQNNIIKICPNQILPDGYWKIDSKRNEACLPYNYVFVCSRLDGYTNNQEIIICKDFSIPEDWIVVEKDFYCKKCCVSQNNIARTIRKAESKYTYSPTYGGSGGAHFQLIPPSNVKKVRSIIISTTTDGPVYVQGLQMEWDLQNGSIAKSDKVGSFQKESEVVLDIQEHEFIKSISGRGNAFIDNLEITIFNSQTEQTKVYQFGGNGGNPFKLDYDICQYTGSKIMGLYGKSGLYIDSIGAIVSCNP